MKVKKIFFKELGDSRGHLVAIENNLNIPFQINRVFYIYGSDREVIRGQHANINSEFVLINVSGKSKIKVMNDGKEMIYELNSPCEGLYIPRLVWKEMYDFSEDSVLLVLSNFAYDPDEYIRNYDEYKLYMKDNKGGVI